MKHKGKYLLDIINLCIAELTISHKDIFMLCPLGVSLFCKNMKRTTFPPLSGVSYDINIQFIWLKSQPHTNNP